MKPPPQSSTREQPRIGLFISTTQIPVGRLGKTSQTHHLLTDQSLCVTQKLPTQQKPVTSVKAHGEKALDYQPFQDISSPFY